MSLRIIVLLSISYWNFWKLGYYSLMFITKVLSKLLYLEDTAWTKYRDNICEILDYLYKRISYDQRVIYPRCSSCFGKMSEVAPEGVKYIVPIKQVEKAIKITDDAKVELQASGMMDDKGKLKIKGVSPKMLKRMKLEGVDCPVLNKEIAFLQCYVCRNFFSRPMGKVYCKGDPL